MMKIHVKNTAQRGYLTNISSLPSLSPTGPFKSKQTTHSLVEHLDD